MSAGDRFSDGVDVFVVLFFVGWVVFGLYKWLTEYLLSFVVIVGGIGGLIGLLYGLGYLKEKVLEWFDHRNK